MFLMNNFSEIISIIMVSKVRWEASDEGRSCERGGDESAKLESQWMTFPIKKRINNIES